MSNLNFTIMKKFLLVIVASLFVTGAFAQDWSVGARAGAGFQAVGQYSLNKENYVEARFGLFCIPGATADLTGLYNWRLFDWNWTPKVGTWFFDAGVGGNLGGNAGCFYIGAAGMARFGITFKKVPISLSIDYTPVLGINAVYHHKVFFHDAGWWNTGITCTYNF